MKLRTRVLLGFTMIFVVVIAAGVFTVNAQRNQLYDQIDDRLLSTPLPPEIRTATRHPSSRWRGARRRRAESRRATSRRRRQHLRPLRRRARTR